MRGTPLLARKHLPEEKRRCVPIRAAAHRNAIWSSGYTDTPHSVQLRAVVCSPSPEINRLQACMRPELSIKADTPVRGAHSSRQSLLVTPHKK